MVLSIKESREFTLFQAFAGNPSFDMALDAIEAHDRKNPKERILASSEDKLLLFESYKIFREAERPIQKGGKSVDYGDMQLLERLKTIISQRLPAISREVVSDSTTSSAMIMANIGRMLAVHAKNVKTLGRKELARQKRQAAEDDKRRTAMIERQGRVNVGGYGGGAVFSVKSSTYKTSGEAIRERMAKEHD